MEERYANAHVEFSISESTIYKWLGKGEEARGVKVRSISVARGMSVERPKRLRVRQRDEFSMGSGKTRVYLNSGVTVELGSEGIDYELLRFLNSLR